MHNKIRNVHLIVKRTHTHAHTHTHTNTHTHTHTHMVAMKRLFASCPSVPPFIGVAATGWISLKFSIGRGLV